MSTCGVKTLSPRDGPVAGDTLRASVALVRCTSYDQLQVDAAVRYCCELLGGIGKFVRAADRVLLKLNLLVGAAPEKAVTTHPSVLRAMIHEVRAGGGVPIVGDCSAVEGAISWRRYLNVCRESGIESVCREEGVELAHLCAESVQVENPGARAFKRFTLAKRVVDADVVISLPKLKTHALTVFTGGVKNCFGCVPGWHKIQMHLRAPGVEPFSQALVDLLATVRPALSLMDAVIGMEGNGPQHGQPRTIGALLASSDAVAVDAVACKMVGIDPQLVLTTRLADEQGVGVGDLARIELLGQPMAAMRTAGFRLPAGGALQGHRKGILGLSRSLLVAKPVLATKRCTGCRLCERHCPSGALSRRGGRMIFDYDQCIHCYCCHELCPEGAIELKLPAVSRALMRCAHVNRA